MENDIYIKNELDNYGALTDPWKDDGVKYDIRKMASYANARNVTITELTEKEKKSYFK